MSGADQITENIINDGLFAMQVNEMRNAQNDYFATRRKGALIKAKELEKEVDNEIIKLLTSKK